MKKALLVSSILATLLSANTILQGIHQDKIKNIDFCNNLVATTSQNKVKVWNLKTQDLITTLKGHYTNNAHFDKNCQNLYYNYYSDIKNYNFKTQKVEKHISLWNIKDFLINGNFIFAFTYNYSTYDKLYKINLNNYNDTYTKIDLKPKKFIVTYTNRYFAIMYDSYVKIYTIDNQLLTKIDSELNLDQVAFINNKLIAILSSNNTLSSLSIYNFKTNEKIKEIKLKDNSMIKDLTQLSPNELIAVNYNKELISIKLPDLSITKIKTLNILPDKIFVSKDKKYVGFIADKKFIIQTLDNLPQSQTIKITETKTEDVKPTINNEKNTKPKIETALVEKLTNQNTSTPYVTPSLDITASKIEGYAPLNTKISIVIDNPQNVVAYYIAIGNKEKIGKGTPPQTIDHTFNSSGTYKVFVAIKDTHNKVIKKTLTIKVKEKTFKDFLKEMN